MVYTLVYQPIWFEHYKLIKLVMILCTMCIIGRYFASGSRCCWPANKSFCNYVALVVGASSGVGFAVTE